MTYAIEAKVGHDVGIVDLCAAFFTCIKWQGCNYACERLFGTVHGDSCTADLLMVQILYVKVQNDLHEMLKIALFFYLKLKGDIEKIGFLINICDQCVATKVINGSRWPLQGMLITWMLDLKEKYLFCFRIELGWTHTLEIFLFLSLYLWNYQLCTFFLDAEYLFNHSPF